jgi:hypothetical protein
MLGFRPQAFASVFDGGTRAIHDALASAVCHEMLCRFPGVRLISVENGGDWVPALLHHLELACRKMPKEFAEHPSETFKRSVWVNSFWEESLAGRPVTAKEAERTGMVNRVVPLDELRDATRALAAGHGNVLSVSGLPILTLLDDMKAKVSGDGS